MDHSISDHVFNFQSPIFGTKKSRYYKPKGLVTSMRHLNTKKQMEVGVQRWSNQIRKFLHRRFGGNSRTCVQWSPSLVMRRQLSFDVSMPLKKQLHKELIFVEKWVMSWWLFSPAKGSNWICTILWGSLLLMPADFSCGAAGRKFSQNHTGSDATMTLSVCIFMISYDVILYYVIYILGSWKTKAVDMER